jgi:hypothetical protein
VAKHVPQRPLAIAPAVEKIVRPADEDPGQLAIGGLREVEDPVSLRSSARQRRGGESLFVPQ